MWEIAISQFKAKCPGLLAQVSKTKKPIRVTRFGKPVAKLFPSAPAERRAHCLGSMADTIEILGASGAPVTTP